MATVTANQLQMMTEVVEQYPDGPFTAYYKQVLASHSWKPDTTAPEQAPKTGSRGEGYGKAKKTFLATPKQLDYIAKLLASRVVPEALHAEATAPGLTFKNASKAIDALKSCPWQPVEAAKAGKKTVSEPAEDGFYFKDDCYYKVKTNVKTGRRAASLWDPQTLTWGYCKGMVYKLSKAERVTPELASAFGDLYGRCMNCNKALSNDESVAKAVGPICWKRLGF